MNVPKDIYFYITNFVDDETIINMLSVNKNFNESYEKVMKTKYPLLIEFKKK